MLLNVSYSFEQHVNPTPFSFDAVAKNKKPNQTRWHLKCYRQNWLQSDWNHVESSVLRGSYSAGGTGAGQGGVTEVPQKMLLKEWKVRSAELQSRNRNEGGSKLEIFYRQWEIAHLCKNTVLCPSLPLPPPTSLVYAQLSFEIKTLPDVIELNPVGILELLLIHKNYASYLINFWFPLFFSWQCNRKNQSSGLKLGQFSYTCVLVVCQLLNLSKLVASHLAMF